MTKVILSKQDPVDAKPQVKTKRVRDAAGRLTSIRVLDGDSPTFGLDFRAVFERNVAKARRENKRLTGKADADLGRD